MERTTLIVYILLTVLTIIYLLLDRFGAIRRVQLSYFGSEYFLRGYERKPRIPDRTVVVVPISENCDLSNVAVFIKSVIDQNVRVDEIIAIGPRKKVSEAKSTLKEDGKPVTFYAYDTPHTNISALYYALKKEMDRNTVVIYLDTGEECRVLKGDVLERALEKFTQDKDKVTMDEETGCYVFAIRTIENEAKNLDRNANVSCKSVLEKVK